MARRFTGGSRFFSEDRGNFIFTTRDVARRIGRSEGTVTKYARDWGEIKALCRKVSGRWMWHRDCFEVFRKLGVGAMIIDVDFTDIVTPVHRAGGVRATAQQRLDTLARIIVRYHQQREITDTAYYEMEGLLRRE